MGNSDIRELAHIETVSVDSISDTTVAVDAYNWLYKYVTTTVQFTDESEYTTQSGVEVPNLHGGISGIKRFYKNDITPVFVFDGGSHDLKEKELERRRETKEKAMEKAKKARDVGDEIEASKMDARAKRLTNPMIRSTMELFDSLNISYIIAPQSGESQAAYMVNQSDSYDYVVSDDYDALLFQSPNTIRNFTSSSKPFESMDLEKTLSEIGLGYKQLIDVAILCGTDYNEGVHGYGPKTAVKKIKEYGNLQNLTENENISVEEYNKIRDIFINPEVEETFPEPSSEIPDIKATKKLLIDKWELPEKVVNTNLDEIDELTKQQTLDGW